MNLSQNAWAAQLLSDENAVVLDVRTDDECSDGIIPNAVLIDIHKGQGFIYSLEELDKNKNYYVYCKAGSRIKYRRRAMSDGRRVYTFVTGSCA